MRNYFWLLILVLSSCADIDSTDLNKCWAQSEVNGNKEIYVLCDDASLSPTWFRQFYEFYANGSCDYLVLAPNDAHYIEEGTYKLLDNNSLLEIKDKQGSSLVSFEIISLSEKKLVLKRQ